MMKPLLAFALTFLFMLESVNAQKLDLSLNVKLKQVSGRAFSIADLKHNKASVIVFYSPECPICTSMIKTVREMTDTFSHHGIRFYLVYPGHFYSIRFLRKFQHAYSLKNSAYRDDSNQLVKLLGASVTPQAFVIDAAGNITYSGKIDNWFEAVGKRRNIITAYYLKDALNAFLEHKEPAIKKTEPVGCFIN